MSTSLSSPPRVSLRALRLAAIGFVVALVVAAKLFGVFDRLGDPARLAKSLVDLGVWGWAAFVFAYAALQPFGVPGTIFVVAAPLIWPWPIAFALSMIGTMAASSIGFSFARFVARDWIAPRIPARFRKFDDALARRAFVTVFVLRLVFWMPPLLHAFFGVSKVRFTTHFWASFLGYLLPLFLMSFFGQRLFDAMRRTPMEVWIGVGVTVLVVVTAVLIVRRRRSASARVSTPAPLDDARG